MLVIEGEDVNELYWRGMHLLKEAGHKEDSRVGKVLVMPEPVTSVYRRPTQRVLFDRSRAANPFFHLFESLWMLAGRDDVEVLNRYITDFGTRFAEPDGRVHGAYGHRWRQALGFDQLDAIVARFKANPRDRQCVLQMWDGRKPRCRAGECEAVDSGSDDLLGDWKDRPCNTHVYFRMRGPTPAEHEARQGEGQLLDMLISCRSNDIVYGAYGANAVHFSILHEYVAGRVGAQVGNMEQLSFNYHAYVDVLERVGAPQLSTYSGLGVRPTPMADTWSEFDNDLTKFMLWHRGLVERGETESRHDYINTWFRHTAEPMFIAHFKWKNAMKNEAHDWAARIAASDWRFAVFQWFDSRTSARSR
jgi:thymidylate synthase